MYVYIDFDAFFALIEERDHPELKGKPVIIGGDPKGGQARGVVSTCNYAARAKGVRSAMPISKAYRLCPEAQFVPPRISDYALESTKIFASLEMHIGEIKRTSIDEGWFELTEFAKLKEELSIDEQRAFLEDVARSIGLTIREHGITGSVGVAPNKTLAKLASDMNKPDGFFILMGHELPTILNDMTPQKISGVGPKGAARMKAKGVSTVADLFTRSLTWTAQHLGSHGIWLRKILQGERIRSQRSKTTDRSMSRERTFMEDENDFKAVKKTLLSLADRTAGQCKSQNYRFKTVTLKVRYSDFKTKTFSFSLSTPTDDPVLLRRTAIALFDKNVIIGSSIRLIGIKVSNLRKPPRDNLDRWICSDARNQQCCAGRSRGNDSTLSEISAQAY